MKKNLRCRIGLHKLYYHNIQCHWFLFDADTTCLYCGKYKERALCDVSLNFIGDIELAQSMEYGPFSTVESAHRRIVNNKKSYIMYIL